MDIYSPEKRSDIMSRIKSKNNSSTENKFYRLIRDNTDIRLCQNDTIFGKPDFIIEDLKIAIFIDGAFWHGHPSSSLPKTNSQFWMVKINQNRKRDKFVNRELRKQGWSVIRFWDFDLKIKNQKKTLSRIKRLISIRTKSGVYSG